MNILLIEQLKRSSQSSNMFLTRFLTTFSILPTLYVRRLAAITPKKHQVTVINERYNPLKITADFDLVVINFNTSCSKIAYEIADQFQRKKITVVLCGLHASALPDEALMHADAVLIGRGECNYLTLLEDIENNALKTIYKPKPFDSSFCQIPPTNLSLPGLVVMGALEATRGCPYQCSFCPEGNTPNANQFYTRPVEEVIDEIKQIPQKILMFYDTSLTIDPTYTKKLFTQMKPLKKRFFCNGNIDVLANDPSFVTLSKKAGCIGWLVGFESFNQQSLHSLGKTSNRIQDYKRAIDNIHSQKMIVIGDFMFGFDSDTVEVFDETISMLNKLHIDVADFTILTPFPGTPLFDELKNQKRLLSTDWDQYTLFNPVFQPKQMSPEQLQNGVRSLYQRFYSSKYIVSRMLRSVSYGFYPFSAVVSRNILSSFNAGFFRK
jgi:radical SAM superfamily enzyme YgiQ (UPF0313 family)